jgi:hypothetical protein
MKGTLKLNGGLNAKQRKFVDYFEGDAVEAARLAGYAYGSENAVMRNPKVLAAIRARKIEKLDPLIESRNERLKWIANQVNTEKHGIKHRLKAMEMLQKSCGDYLEPAQPSSGHQQAPPTLIVIRPGKDAQTAITINPQDGQGDRGLVDVTGGGPLPIKGGIGDGVPDGSGKDWMDGKE